MSARKVTITIREFAEGLSMDIHVPPHMRESAAEVMAEAMLQTARMIGDDFAADHGLPRTSFHEGKSGSNPFRKLRQ